MIGLHVHSSLISIRFTGDQVKVRGYLELRTTFTNGTASRIESIRYLVVNANSAYSILLGRPTLNRLRAVASTRHMKMKLSDLSGKVIIIKSDQEEGKCYESSLRTKRGVFMVLERSPISATPMKVESIEEATSAKPTPVEASPAEAMPGEDVRLEKTHGEVSPMEEVSEGASPIGKVDEATPIGEDRRNESRAESVRDRRPQPVDNVVERQIGDKIFKLGRLLSQEEQDEVAAVISRHLDAFTWIALDMPGIDPYFLCHHLTMDLKLNPEKCVFGVKVGKFLGFMLTKRFAAIIAIRSPTLVKEVQQLTGRMAALSRFVSAGGEKGHPYFQCLKRNSRFTWTDESEAVFLKLKEYLATPPVLCKPRVGVPLRLYFAVTEWAISFVLVQEHDQV